MIILDTTTRSLEIDLNGAVTTNQLPFVASYVDISQSTFAVSAASTNTGTSNSTTAVTLVAAPGATTSRQLKYLSVKNSDTVATLLWIQLNDNTTLREIWKGTLAVGDTLVYVDSLGFNVLNSSGQIKTGSGISSIGASTDNALVRWDGTGGTAIQNSGWTLDDSNVLTAGGNLSLGANYISRAGTAAGLSLDASNNTTLSGTLTVSGNGTSIIGGASQSNLTIKDTSAYSAGVNGAALYFQGLDSGSTNTSFGYIKSFPATANPDRGYLSVYTRVNGVATAIAQFGTGLAADFIVPQGTITTGSTTALSLATSGGTVMTLVNAGNVGIGVTPSAWGTSGSAYKAMQYGVSGFLAGRTSNETALLGTGAYHNGTNWIYSIDGNNASLYEQASAIHSFKTAPVGTVGNTCTFVEQVRITHTASATNYITLTGSNGGNPTIGVSGGGLDISTGASTTFDVYMNAALAMRIKGGTTESRLVDGIRIGADSTNNLLDDASTGAGTATLYIGNASINVTSDENVKRNIKPFTGGLALVLQLQPIEFDQNENRPFGNVEHYVGFGARRSHKVAPWTVNTQGDTGLPWQMRQEFLMAPVVSAIQELARDVAELKARL